MSLMLSSPHDERAVPGSSDGLRSVIGSAIQRGRDWYKARIERRRILRHGTRLDILRVLSGAPIQKVVTKRLD